MNIPKIEEKFRTDENNKFAAAPNGMVASAFPEATRAGVEMLGKGGNAVDAACATALALGVCEPQSSGLGGQSSVILHFRGKTIALDGSSRVPSLAHISKFAKGERSKGYRATTIPTTVAVMGYLNFKYGKLEWKDILQPAIRIASEGYRITELQHRLQERELENFLKIPSKSGAKYFLKNGSEPYQPGDLFIQPDLANTLLYLSEHGPRSFYQGMIAKRIDDDMQANKGFLRADDLALMPWPVERRILKRHYRSVSIKTAPPPAAGRTLLLVMLMLRQLPVRIIRQESAQFYHFFSESLRKAFLFRTQRPFDPNTFLQISDKKMINRKFAQEQAKSIRDRIDPSLPLVDPKEDEDGETTHLSTMDNEGNAVGITQSIELSYGARTAAEGLGFLYNNYIRALDINDPSHPHYLRPNATPWTSVAPSIVFYKDKPWIVTGSPGSERIYSTVAQFLTHILDKDQSMARAVENPRLHCSLGGKVSIEADRFNPEIVTYLEEMGYQIEKKSDFDFYFGAIHSVMKCLTREGFQGAAEVRRDGTAGGI
ncbi:MAG: gamma-glutamyltransferase [Acidobacteria bacterium]|nr:gamma-glutamyltransferase [Acidobacteriota bacterium]